MEWAEANLRKAKAKVAEKAAAVEGFERAVRQCERHLAAVVARVKDEEVARWWRWTCMARWRRRRA